MQVNDWNLTFFRYPKVFSADLKHFRPSVHIQVIQVNLDFKNIANQEVGFFGKIGNRHLSGFLIIHRAKVQFA